MKSLKRKFVNVLAVSVLFVSGCNDEEFLDTAPLDTTTSASFFLTEEDAVRSINTAYDPMQNYWYYNFSVPVTYNILSGDAIKGGNSLEDQGEYNQFANFGLITSDNSRLQNMWELMFIGVNRSNLVLANVPNIEDMSEAIRSRILAEARFLRGLHYFNIVTMFGRAPLLTEPASLDNLDQPLATSAEIYAQIEADFTAAADVLPDSHDASNIGRATKGAANAFLAKARIFQGKIDQTTSDLLDAVINSPVGYSLLGNYSDNFSVCCDNNSESIFEVQFGSGADVSVWAANGVADINANWTNVTMGPRNTTVPRGWGFNQPTQEFLDFFNANSDSRGEDTIFVQGDALPCEPGSTYDETVNSGTMGPYNFKKYQDFCGSRYDSAINFKVMRLAEVLLLKAEVENELGNTGTAEGFMNQTRARVGLAPITGLSQTDLRMAILSEKRAELGMEGQYFLDIIRMGMGPDFYADRGFVQGKSEVMPIPASEIAVNGWEQNNGY
ncbi:RagB/SusD family nutrient uptake outer membrane protein [Maribacter sp. 2304DJ31-5]|uniref:RagB/SusD family nutrient uptake outer membrane protein n=1 Tax=Maribacter sp. 2304DJ31-5 TaxID=3386273 RepID=UPI0039BC66F8